ncbi:MAG: hypothetical protein M0Q88_00835 [Bacilli bacterium]|nr:hypothetical protein [Bacilli bacterium]
MNSKNCLGTFKLPNNLSLKYSMSTNDLGSKSSNKVSRLLNIIDKSLSLPVLCVLE